MGVALCCVQLSIRLSAMVCLPLSYIDVRDAARKGKIEIRRNVETISGSGIDHRPHEATRAACSVYFPNYTAAVCARSGAQHVLRDTACAAARSTRPHTVGSTYWFRLRYVVTSEPVPGTGGQ